MPTAWESPGEAFSGIDVRSGQLQQFNYLNPASIDQWIIKVRAYLDERGCLKALTDPRVKDLATFSAEYSAASSGKHLDADEINAA